MAWDVGKYSVSLNFNPKSNNLESTAGFVKGSNVSTHDCTVHKYRELKCGLPAFKSPH